ncbi:MAG: DUF2993 domain-containing protein [Clostridia bacterium]|nr:DUF2993 domain-containing protein [Clostridia bacterium]
MLRRFFGLSAVVIMILSLLAHAALVPLAEKALTRVAARLPAEDVEIRIVSFPAWELLQGRIDRMNFRARGVQLKEIALDELHGEFHGIEVSWWQLWYQNQLDYALEVPGEVTCILSERNLQDYLSQRLNVPLEELQVTIYGEQVELTAMWSVAGQRLPLLLRGRLELVPPDTVKLLPERIQVGNFAPGPEIQKRLLGNTDFQLPLESLPFELEFYKLEGEQGKIKLHGRVFKE